MNSRLALSSSAPANPCLVRQAELRRSIKSDKAKIEFQPERHRRMAKTIAICTNASCFAVFENSKQIPASCPGCGSPVLDKCPHCGEELPDE